MTPEEFLERAAAIERLSRAAAAEAIGHKVTAQLVAQTHILAAFFKKGLLDDGDVEGILREIQTSANTMLGISSETRREIANTAVELRNGLTNANRRPN